MSLPRLVVVGGHGKVALLFSKLASSSNDVRSLVRSKEHFSDIEKTGAKPVLLSLEEASTAQLTEAFEGAKGVLFSAGSGGKGGPERTRAVDYEGAVKVFDAIEALQGEKPKLVLVGALDTRDTSKPPPAHYTQEDIEQSKKAHDAIGTYYDYKLKADRDLVKRTAFEWTILRPGHLLDEAGKGEISLGRTHMGGVPREDVASTLLELFDQPKSSRLVLDLISGRTPIKEAVQKAVDAGISDYQE